MWEYRLGSLEDLRDLCAQLGVGIDAAEDVSILAEPVEVGRLRIPNSLAVHPMEGCDGDSQGRPGPLTIRRYERFAAGGAGLIWAEATAVVPEGRANPRQLWLHAGSKEAFAALVERIRTVAAESMGSGHRPVVVLQLTHSGRYSKPSGKAEPMILQRDPYRDALVPQQSPDPTAASRIPDDWPIVSDEYLDQLQDRYVEAARLAFEAGFDAVDIKSCHGYLINELFACHQRQGKYGGSFENRVRFVLGVVDKILSELGPTAQIVTRLGIYDGIPYPYGWAVDRQDYSRWDLTEPKKLIELLRQRGVRLINITAGNPYYNPHIGRPFNEPIVGGYPEPEHPLAGVWRLVQLAGQIQREFADIAVVGTGYSWLRQLFANVAAANKSKGLVRLVGAGRMAFAYPDFAKDILRHGRMFAEKVCISCSGCTQIMRDGGRTGCVVRDRKVYGPIFEQGRLRDRDNLVRLASLCRKCQEPTCRSACPAGVDVPRFIELFAAGDERGAYEVLRGANIFPEICGWLCPVEQQCEGHCLEGLIGDRAVPIAAIQRYLAEQANRQGWSRLRVPAEGSGKRVAVIGAGPAGLACAAKLLEAGHSVTIFDRSRAFGGLVESAVPPQRQSDSLKRELSAVFADVPAERMELRLGVELTPSYNLDSVMAEGFDAAFVALGLGEVVSLAERRLEGLWDALEFLAAAKGSDRPDLAGKRVAVVGGGNTAMDAAVTAKQLGARDVYVIYRRSFEQMPAWPSERQRAIEAGVHILVLTQPLEYCEEDGAVRAVRLCPVMLGEPDQSGRRKPEPIESSCYSLPMDVVIEAIGQRPAEDLGRVLSGVELVDGLIRTEGGFASSRVGVFAGGDLVRGPATVVQAVADGMRAADQIDRFLKGDE